MSLSDDQIAKIIERAQSSMNAAQNSSVTHATEDFSVLALVPGFVPAPEKALSALMAQYGARCFLIGESLMRQADVAAATRALLARPLTAQGGEA